MKTFVNDIDAAAVESIERNLKFNAIDTSRCIPNKGDAGAVLYAHKRRR